MASSLSFLLRLLYPNCTKAPSNAPFTTTKGTLTFNLGIRAVPSSHGAILVMQQTGYPQSDWPAGISAVIDFRSQETQPKSPERFLAVIKWKVG